MTQRTKHSFSGWVQDAGTDAGRLCADLALRRVDEDDIASDTQEEIMSLCECLCDAINKARQEIEAADEDRAGLRKMKHREYEAAE